MDVLTRVTTLIRQGKTFTEACAIIRRFYDEIEESKPTTEEQHEGINNIWPDTRSQYQREDA